MTTQELFVRTLVVLLIWFGLLVVLVIAANDLMDEESGTSKFTKFLEAVVAFLIVCVLFAGLVTLIVEFFRWIL